MEKLKEIRDVILFGSLLVGGFIWIEDRYSSVEDATRLANTVEAVRAEMATEQQIAVLECILTEYMKLTQLQIRAQDLEKRMGGLIDALDDVTVASLDAGQGPALVAVLNGRQAELEDTRRELNAADLAMQDINDRLQRQECGRLA